jgi:hypothetical protein
MPVWTGAENLAPSRFRSPDGPARSESLFCPTEEETGKHKIQGIYRKLLFSSERDNQIFPFRNQPEESSRSVGLGWDREFCFSLGVDNIGCSNVRGHENLWLNEVKGHRDTVHSGNTLNSALTGEVLF